MLAVSKRLSTPLLEIYLLTCRLAGPLAAVRGNTGGMQSTKHAAAWRLSRLCSFILFLVIFCLPFLSIFMCSCPQSRSGGQEARVEAQWAVCYHLLSTSHRSAKPYLICLIMKSDFYRAKHCNTGMVLQPLSTLPLNINCIMFCFWWGNWTNSMNACKLSPLMNRIFIHLEH